MRAGAIDIGSNSILLTIAEPDAPKAIPLKILFDEARVTGLSKGLQAGGVITPEAQNRAFDCLKDYRRELDKFKPDVFKAVGTEAFRRATNGEEVRTKISEILQTPLEIISGDQEAELSFWSVQKEHPDSQALKIVFDIGGASTELCLGNDRGILERVSLKVGSVVLTEKFGLDRVSSATQASHYVRSLIEEASWTKTVAQNPSLGIGVAGTMTSMIAVVLGLTDYDRAQVHGFAVDSQRVQQLRDRILSTEGDQRRSIRGLEPNRADVFGGGMTIASAICDYFHWKKVTCMDAGIRFGVLYELLKL